MIVKEKMMVGYMDEVLSEKGCFSDVSIIVKQQIDENGNVKTKVCGWHAGEPFEDSIKEFGKGNLATDFGESGKVTRIEREICYYKDLDITVIWEYGYWDDWKFGKFVKDEVFRTKALIGAHGGRPNEKTWECVGQVEFWEEKQEAEK